VAGRRRQSRPSLHVAAAVEKQMLFGFEARWSDPFETCVNVAPGRRDYGEPQSPSCAWPIRLFRERQHLVRRRAARLRGDIPHLRASTDGADRARLPFVTRA